MAQINPLIDRLDQLPYMECIIGCKSSAGMPLPVYKGATFHGGFGWALAALDAELLQLLYDCRDHNGHTVVKPFVLVPPTDNLTYYPKDHLFAFRLKLFGRATDHVQDILAAMFLWQQKGLGKASAGFTIQYIDLQLPSHCLRIFQQGCEQYQMVPALSLGHFIKHQQLSLQGLPYNKLSAFVNTITPMDLRKNNKQLLQAPEAKVLFWLIAQRLSQLCLAYGNDRQADFHGLLPSDEPPLMLSQTTVFEQMRTSTLLDSEHALKGLQGGWIYYINDELSLVWLLIGRVLHVGKKSSFGFGAYDFTLAVRQ